MYSNNHLSKWIAFGLILVALVAMIGCNTSNRPAVKPELAGVNTQADAPQAAEVTKPDSAKSYADIVKAVEELDRSTSVLTGQITNAQTFINARPKDDVINRATVAELAEMISTKIVPAPVDPEAKKTMPVVAKEVAGYEIVADYRTDVADVIPFKITRLADEPERWAAMGAVSRSIAEAHGLEATVRKYENLYCRLVGQPGFSLQAPAGKESILPAQLRRYK